MDRDLRSYLETALWSSITEEEGNPLDDTYSIDDIDKASIEKAEKEVKAFEEKAESLLSDDDKAQHVGHDFWLTRNGHGAGFWDGDYVNGEALTQLAKSFGTCDMYVGDDGKVYLS